MAVEDPTANWGRAGLWLLSTALAGLFAPSRTVHSAQTKDFDLNENGRQDMGYPLMALPLKWQVHWKQGQINLLKTALHPTIVGDQPKYYP